jgi:hypothetical protein
MPQWLTAILDLLGMGAGNAVPPPTPTYPWVIDYLDFPRDVFDLLDFPVQVVDSLNFVMPADALNFVE